MNNIVKADNWHFKQNIKKLLCILLTLACLFLSSCQKLEKNETVSAGKSQVSKEVFTYYTSLVNNRPGDYGLVDNSSNEQVEAAAKELCIKYLAINTDFARRGLALTPAQKAEIAQNVNNYCLAFSSHYENIGVSRQTPTKIFTNKAYEESVFTSIYDLGQNNSAAEAAIKNYFYSNYVSFRAVCTYYSNDDRKATQQEKLDIVTDFANMKNEFDPSADNPALEFSLITQNYGYIESESILLKKGSATYPAGFFEKVLYMKSHTVEIANYDECIFIIFKNSPEDIGDSVFSTYRAACINDMHADEWEAYLEELCEQIR